ncbi:hypothetical protein FACS1894103_5590 [Campylobacterota bacterium]|nr:hypothetical protein FACS1894103_5590 [Campylobacterota bacterium]
MDMYPRVLLPNRSYPILSCDDVLKYYFVRETENDIYTLPYESDSDIDFVIRKMLAPQFSGAAVYALSIFLYGYYNEAHIGIRAKEVPICDWDNTKPVLKPDAIKINNEKGGWFPLFLYANKLFEQSVIYSGTANAPATQYKLSFVHRPTSVNYWHFELSIKDAAGNAVEAGKKALAKSALKNVVFKAICRDLQNIEPFKRDDFDVVLSSSTSDLQ